MGLALLDVADLIRPHPEVVALLEHSEEDGFLDELSTLAGGRRARDAIRAFLDGYGMRCGGEIDITRPRWSERPTTLVPMIPWQRQELRARNGQAPLRARPAGNTAERAGAAGPVGGRAGW